MLWLLAWLLASISPCLLFVSTRWKQSMLAGEWQLPQATTVAAIAAAASGLRFSGAVPHAQQDGALFAKRAPATYKVNDTCDVAQHRIACANDTALLFCSNSKWVDFSNCNPGTVCREGMCVFADQATATNTPVGGAVAPSQAASSGASSQKQQQQSASVSASRSPAASSHPASTAASSATALPASSPSPPSSSSSSGGGGSDSGSGGSSGNSFGITCDKFSKAVVEASKAINTKYPAPSDSQCKSFLKGMTTAGGISSAREAAMFLSNILWESDGLQAKEEYACQDMPDWCAQNYKTPEDVAGQTYWGRGYIQLTWHYNYLDASKGLFGDDRLAKNTAQVSSNEDLAWNVSFWFWKDRVRSDPGVPAGNFGASINKINGGLECRGAAQDKAKKRYAMYKVVLPIFAPGETPKESGCYN
ncbi:lysozyme-like protein [Martensiomyces pterosporus]|nr:lysozyme-like protein [Martensiomyces pterosporus]